MAERNGPVNVYITDAHGVVIGDHAEQHNAPGAVRQRRVLVGFTPELARFPEVRPFARAATEAVAAAGCELVAMPRSTHRLTPRQFRERVEDFDVYVCLLGFRYGRPVKNAWWKSYPRLGLDVAMRSGKPYLAVVIVDSRGYTADRDFYLDKRHGRRQERFRRAVRSGGYHHRVADDPTRLAKVLEEFLTEPDGEPQEDRRAAVDVPAVAGSLALGAAGFLMLSSGLDVSAGWAAVTAVLAAAGAYLGGRRGSD